LYFFIFFLYQYIGAIEDRVERACLEAVGKEKMKKETRCLFLLDREFDLMVKSSAFHDANTNVRAA
jgi:hypothetical protein